MCPAVVGQQPGTVVTVEDGSRGKREREGVLRGHYKSGRVYKPQLLAYPQTTANDWFRDDLPDLLWPLMLVGVRGRSGSAAMGRLQERVIGLVEKGELAESDLQLDGRLTSLEACTPRAREVLLALLENEELRASVIPAEVVGVLRIYSDVPGAWLLVDPWGGLDGVPDFDDATKLLTDAMVGALGDRHLNALTKAAPFGWSLVGGKMHFVGDQGDDLINYPMDDEKRDRADAFILSSFLTDKAIRAMQHPDLAAAAERWARRFWMQNWDRFPCLVEDDERTNQPDDDVTGDAPRSSVEARENPEDGEPQLHSVADIVGDALARVDEIYEGFLEDALDHSQPVDLYKPARHEVLCGLSARIYRAVVAMLQAPHLWTGEHASGLQRSISETRIVIQWLVAHGDEAFERYQEYGRGRRKLMRKHTEALVERFGDDVPDLVKGVADELAERTGGDWQEEFQEVSIEATFAGISLRQMAEEVDALDEYRYVMQPASGVLHGEWWALEDYAMERCCQLLHRGHWLPVATAEGHPTLAFADLMVARFGDLVALARAGIGGQRRDEP